MQEHRSHTLIEDSQHLREVCEQLLPEHTLAIDTEFVRESTYHPIFCLLQIATREATYCIDPLRATSLEPFKHLLASPHITFVIHSARQDLEVLLQTFGLFPTKFLDSQIAAGMAGHHDQTGYAPLIEKLTGIKLSKEQTRTDWSQRPLTAEQLGYAANDVTYLIEAYELLKLTLSTLDRTAWWEEDSMALLSPPLYEIDNPSAWKKVKGLLDLPLEAVARGLIIAEWREEAAKSLNKPRNWILRDEDLLNWAYRGEIPAQGIRMRGTPSPHQRVHFDRLRDLLEAEPPLALAETLSAAARAKIDPARKGLIKRLSACTQSRAEQLGISSTVIAARKDLETLIDHPDRSRLLMGWRKEVIGDALVQVIADNKP